MSAEDLKEAEELVKKMSTPQKPEDVKEENKKANEEKVKKH
jgi:hypothetical protein